MGGREEERKGEREKGRKGSGVEWRNGATREQGSMGGEIVRTIVRV